MLQTVWTHVSILLPGTGSITVTTIFGFKKGNKTIFRCRSTSEHCSVFTEVIIFKARVEDQLCFSTNFVMFYRVFVHITVPERHIEIRSPRHTQVLLINFTDHENSADRHDLCDVRHCLAIPPTLGAAPDEKIAICSTYLQ
jgi:hypothetical protein